MNADLKQRVLTLKGALAVSPNTHRLYSHFR